MYTVDFFRDLFVSPFFVGYHFLGLVRASSTHTCGREFMM